MQKHKTQYIMSRSKRMFVERYYTKKGQRLNQEIDEKLEAGVITADEHSEQLKSITDKYCKNRYINNMPQHVVKTITHKPAYVI